MQNKHLYEYAVIRLVPKVERGEYINIGVVLYCKILKSLKFKYHIEKPKIEAFYKEVDFDELLKHVNSFDKICKGDLDSGLIGAQDTASRFRWLTARRSTILQASEIHPGYCEDPDLALIKIFEEMVA